VLAEGREASAFFGELAVAFVILHHRFLVAVQPVLFGLDLAHPHHSLRRFHHLLQQLDLLFVLPASGAGLRLFCLSFARLVGQPESLYFLMGLGQFELLLLQEVDRLPLPI
jgi:hypothetical protein